jgi:hypothetical protein
MENTAGAFRESLPQLVVRIESTKAVAPSVEEFDKRKTEEVALVNSFLKGEISSKEYEDREAALAAIGGALEFGTLPEYSRVLKAIGFPKELVEEILAHENAHMNLIESYGISGAYTVQFYKEHDTDPEAKFFGIHPSVSYGLAEETDDEKRRILKEIIEAPKDLSEYDLAQLGNGSIAKTKRE